MAALSSAIVSILGLKKVKAQSRMTARVSSDEQPRIGELLAALNPPEGSEEERQCGAELKELLTAGAAFELSVDGPLDESWRTGVPGAARTVAVRHPTLGTRELRLIPFSVGHWVWIAAPKDALQPQILVLPRNGKVAAGDRDQFLSHLFSSAGVQQQLPPRQAPGVEQHARHDIGTFGVTGSASASRGITPAFDYGRADLDPSSGGICGPHGGMMLRPDTLLRWSGEQRPFGIPGYPGAPGGARFDPIMPGGPRANFGPAGIPSRGAPQFPGEPDADHLRPYEPTSSGQGAAPGMNPPGRFNYGW